MILGHKITTLLYIIYYILCTTLQYYCACRLFFITLEVLLLFSYQHNVLCGLIILSVKKYPCYCVGNNSSLEVSSPFICAIAIPAFTLKHERAAIRRRWVTCEVAVMFCRIIVISGWECRHRPVLASCGRIIALGAAIKWGERMNPFLYVIKNVIEEALRNVMKAEWLHYEYECLKKGGDADVWMYRGERWIVPFPNGIFALQSAYYF